MKGGLVSLESLHPNIENIEKFYEADNFSDAIAFGFLFVFCDGNTYFQLKCAINFFWHPVIFKNS